MHLLIPVQEILIGCVLLYIILCFSPPDQQRIVLHSVGAAMHYLLGSLNFLLKHRAKKIAVIQ